MRRTLMAQFVEHLVANLVINFFFFLHSFFGNGQFGAHLALLGATTVHYTHTPMS